MAGKIPPEFIDQLLSRVDIVEIIDHRVHLKKAGKDYQALCPFHTEKSPSFTVSPDKQFYHCFGCGAHGTAIGFLMEFEHMEFREAVEELARQAGMEIPQSASGRAPSRTDTHPLLDVLQRADTFYRQQLRAHPEARKAVDYLKQRGLSGKIAAEFGLGYAPPGWDNLLRQLGTNEQEISQLASAGLITEQPGKRYDRFRDRITFPIRDRRGRTVGFGGRVLGDDKPKYLNSPETPVFHKGQELYGLYEARKALRHIDRLLVVEGYMDVIALAQYGIRYAVATLGTATTPHHLEQLFRVCRELVFCFDGDQAGRDAAWKALITALPSAREGREIRFLFLPEREDPDTLVRKIGAEAFEQQARNATYLSEYFFHHLSADIDMGSVDGRSRLVDNAKPLLAMLPQGVFREMMTDRLSKLAGLTPDRLGLETKPRPAPAAPRRRPAQPHLTPVRRAITLLLQRPSLAAGIAHLPDKWRHLDAPGITLLGKILDLALAHPNLTTAAIVERWRDSEHFPHLNTLANQVLVGIEEDPLQELEGALERLNRQAREQETELLYRKNRRPSEMSEEDKRRLKALLRAPNAVKTADTKMER